jgi:cell wall-associated NlpC family hydrolase
MEKLKKIAIVLIASVTTLTSLHAKPGKSHKHKSHKTHKTHKTSKSKLAKNVMKTAKPLKMSKKKTGNVFTHTNTHVKSKNIIHIAKTRLGRKYRYGRYDCSKFVQDVMKHAKGRRLPRTTRQQIKIGKHISNKKAKSGDLVFFGDSKHYVGHVGIIIDPKKKLMIHNSSVKGKVVISSYNTKYYRKKYRGIRRV